MPTTEDAPEPTSAPDAAREPGRIEAFLREESAGGKVLLIATAVALLWANLSGDSYRDMWGTEISVGPDWLHLHLTLAELTADGILAVFFFVAGLELKRELLVGQLADHRAAVLPFFAALGGMVAPALIALALSGGDAAEGGAWAIPVATDIAFALGVLAVAGSALPRGVRALLLSIAVIDDLGAIALIAIVFTKGLAIGWLAGGLALCLLYRAALKRGIDAPAMLWALAVAAWVAIHASGVHATVAGILLALLTPLRTQEEPSPAARLEHKLHPWSAGFAVPLFALGAAGVPLAAIGDIPGDSIARAVVVGLLAGKVIGILGGSWLAVRARLASLPPGVGWADVAPVGVLGGIGYTVSLLIAHLSLDTVEAQETAAAAVLCASLLASLMAVVMLRRRSRRADAA